MEQRENTLKANTVNNDKLIVKLPEIDPEAFLMVLKYIYTDRIDPTEKVAEPFCPWMMELVMEVYGAGVKLLIPRLQRLCARYLRAGIGLNTVLHALRASHIRHLSAVKEYCLRYFN